MSPWLFDVYMDGAMKLKMGIGGRGVRFREDGLLYANDLVLCGVAQMCRRRGLKVNAGKSKMMEWRGGIIVLGSCRWDSFRACLGI